MSRHRNRNYRKVTKGVVYSATANTSSWIPGNPLEIITGTSRVYAMAFEPMLDMKVG